jgi:hypothetical protein
LGLSTFIIDKKIFWHHTFVIPSYQQDILHGMLIYLIEKEMGFDQDESP